MRLSVWPLVLGLTATTARYIVPGARWLDTDGNLINAHAGNIIYQPSSSSNASNSSSSSGLFYWFGEYKPSTQPEGAGVSVYSSPDLATWTYQGIALSSSEGSGSSRGLNLSIIQRPKVVYSENTQKWHMWWHADNSSYGLLLQGFATAEQVEGPYEFVSATSPLGNWSQDFGMFTATGDNGQGMGRTYALYSNGDTEQGRDDYISVFNEDITELEEVVYRFPKYDLEAPGIVEYDGGYFMLMSHKTGYRPNDVVAFRADGLEGPWSQPVPIAPADTRTWNSQSGFVMRIQGSEATTQLYLGDQWDAYDLEDSRYVWLPLSIDSDRKSISLAWRDVYDLDVATGVVREVAGTTYTADAVRVRGGAYLQEASFATTGVVATGIWGNDSTVTFSGVLGAGPGAQQQWVSFYYQNIDDMGFGNQPGGSPDRIGGSFQLRRISRVVVNGKEEEGQTLVQRDSNKGVVLSTALLLTLEEGDGNEITVGGASNGFDVKGADLDRIVVYPPETAAAAGA